MKQSAGRRAGMWMGGIAGVAALVVSAPMASADTTANGITIVGSNWTAGQSINVVLTPAIPANNGLLFTLACNSSINSTTTAIPIVESPTPFNSFAITPGSGGTCTLSGQSLNGQYSWGPVSFNVAQSTGTGSA